MNFIEAIKHSTWVRRQRWTSWICIKDGGIAKYLENVTKEDVLADDWIAYEAKDESIDMDDSSLRFMLLELE